MYNDIKITPIIIFRDSNDPPKYKKNCSGKRHRIIPNVVCKICGLPIPGTNGLRRKTRIKYHKKCRPYTPKTERAHGLSIPERLHGSAFIKRFDEAFGLKPIEVN